MRPEQSAIARRALGAKAKNADAFARRLRGLLNTKKVWFFWCNFPQAVRLARAR